MLKLVKYELRGNLFTIIGICITVIIANLLLLTRRSSWGIELVGGLSIILAFIALIVIFIFSLNIMSKYLHQDSGYLLFTLPQSGTSIIISRLLTALIQNSIVISVSLLSFYLIAGKDIPLEFLKYFKVSEMILIVIQYIWVIVSFLTFIYFCMIIGKVAFRNKKIGKLGSFVAFILISVLIGWIALKIEILFPQTIDISNLLKSTTMDLKINISSWILEICTFVIFFISGSYLLDKKIDL